MISRLSPLSTLPPADGSVAVKLPNAPLLSRGLGWRALLVCALAAQGAAIARSPLAAAPILLVLLAACAVEIPALPFLALTLLVRVLTDSSLSSASAGGAGVNVSGGLAVLFIVMAAGLLAQRRRGLWPTLLAGLWLAVWTTVALHVHGGSTQTMRQGVRETAILAVGVIVLNSAREITVSTAARLVQLVGALPALLALYQLATHTGLRIEGHVRAYGTFNHPDGAAMFFAIAATASLWRYLCNGRRRTDGALIVLFAFATVATFSLTGIASLLAMLVAFGVQRAGSLRVKLRAFAIALVVVVGFLLTPYGAARIANESSTQLGYGNHLLATTSLGWRLYKWQTLIPQWEAHPFLGEGLGATVTEEGAEYYSTKNLPPHNEYLRYLVETGVIGAALLLWGLWALIRGLSRRRGSPAAPDGAVLALAVLVGCLVNALADNTLLYTTTGYAAAVIFAAVLRLPGRARDRQPRRGSVEISPSAPLRLHADRPRASTP